MTISKGGDCPPIIDTAQQNSFIDFIVTNILISERYNGTMGREICKNSRICKKNCAHFSRDEDYRYVLITLDGWLHGENSQTKIFMQGKDPGNVFRDIYGRATLYDGTAWRGSEPGAKNSECGSFAHLRRRDASSLVSCATGCRQSYLQVVVGRIQ